MNIQALENLHDNITKVIKESLKENLGILFDKSIAEKIYNSLCNAPVNASLDVVGGAALAIKYIIEYQEHIKK